MVGARSFLFRWASLPMLIGYFEFKVLNLTLEGSQRI
jgi:hypothetical protein